MSKDESKSSAAPAKIKTPADVREERELTATEREHLGRPEPGPGVSGETTRHLGQAARMKRATMTEAEWQSQLSWHRVIQLADECALSLLQNPKIDQLLARNPLEPGRAGDQANVGAALAHGALRLAKDYVQTLDALVRNTDPQLFDGDLTKGPDENADLNRPA